MTSPVPFDGLKAKSSTRWQEEGHDYQLLVCLAGAETALGGVAMPFRVAANATAAFPKPRNAEAAIREMERMADEGNPGDALGLFATLPPDIRENAEIAALEKRLRERIHSAR